MAFKRISDGDRIQCRPWLPQARTFFTLLLTFLLAGCTTSLRDPFWQPSRAYPQPTYNPPPLASPYPAKIALLLPLQGQLAESATALQNGFFAAYSELPKSSAPSPKIQTYDSTAGTIQSVYERAVHEGANVVVGPLTKPEIEQLVAEDAISLPTLALNYLPDDKEPFGRSRANFYQFGLAPEDEAVQLADKLYQKGYEKPIVIAPNDQLGKRAVAAFLKQAAQYHTATPVEVFEFNATEDVSGQFNHKFKAYEQGIAPFDSVALVALPREARQLRPLISYYFSENIPVYATSHLFTGMVSAPADQDLDHTYFCDIPWLLDKAHAFTSPIDPASERFKRLFALGYDAFNLIPYLDQLGSQAFRWSGLTGRLKADGHVLHRQLSWGQFRDGKPVPVE